MTVGDVLAASAARWPNNIALIEGGRRIGYRDLDRLANRVADALIAAGCGAGRHAPWSLPTASSTRRSSSAPRAAARCRRIARPARRRLSWPHCSRASARARCSSMPTRWRLRATHWHRRRTRPRHASWWSGLPRNCGPASSSPGRRSSRPPTERARRLARRERRILRHLHRRDDRAAQGRGRRRTARAPAISEAAREPFEMEPRRESRCSARRCSMSPACARGSADRDLRGDLVLGRPWDTEPFIATVGANTRPGAARGACKCRIRGACGAEPQPARPTAAPQLWRRADAGDLAHWLPAPRGGRYARPLRPVRGRRPSASAAPRIHATSPALRRAFLP